MVTLEITLPEEMLIFAETQAATKGLGNISHYLLWLLNEDRKATEQAEFEARFDAAIRAIEKGQPSPLTPEDWQRLRDSHLDHQTSEGG